MLRKMMSLVGKSGLGLVIIFATVHGHAQDVPAAAPSLGDVARQLRNAKGAPAPQKKVLTNEDLVSQPTTLDFKGAAPGASSDAKPPLAPSGNGSLAAVGSGSAVPSLDQAKMALDRMDILLNQVDIIDRSALVKTVLNGKDPDFPGHEAWEQRLFTARQVYVTRGRELVQDGRQLLDATKGLEAAHAAPDDPRVQSLNAQLKQFVQECVQTGSAFQAVVLEGRDLAGQSAAH